MGRLPEGFFHEADPGQVELFGSDLVNMLAEEMLPASEASNMSRLVLSALARREGVGLSTQLQSGDGRAVVRALFAAVAEVRPGLTLDQILFRLERHAGGQRFFTHWLDALATVACSALALGQGMRLDPALSIVRLTIGLPAGEVDPLASVFRQRFPHAGVTLGSLPDAIEFLFDVRNLPAAALMTHELSRPHYEAANPWEREKLWHYPLNAADGEEVGRNRSVKEKVDQGTGDVRPFVPLRQAAASNGHRNGLGKIQELIFPGDLN